jgi:photosystem II stability/assembly factor-like uncharacterized protein
MKKSLLLNSVAFFLCVISLDAQNWTKLTSGTYENLWSVSFPSSTIGYTVGENGTVLKTTNGGSSWTALSAPSAVTYYNVNFINENLGFIMGESGRIEKTTDGGATWVQKTSGIVHSIMASDILSDGTTIYAAGGGSGIGVILKSSDAGETWTALAQPANVVFRGIDFDKTNPQTGYLVGEGLAGASNSIYKTTNGGSSWTLLTTPYSDISNFFAVSVVDQNNFVAVGGNKRILKSANGGTNWSQLDNSAANYYRGVHFSNPTNGYVVGGNGKILFTSNGTSFTSQNSGTQAILNDVIVVGCGTVIVVGDEGSILRKTPISVVNDTYSTVQDSAIAINAAQGVLSNDVQIGGFTLTAAIVNTTTNGTLVFNADGSFTYSPSTGFFGADQFTYNVTDPCENTAAQNITVTINVAQSTISVGKISAKDPIRIYPTVVDQELNLELYAENFTKIEIRNINGSLIQIVDATKKSQIVNLADLSAGVYAVIVYKNNAIIYREKIIKK